MAEPMPEQNTLGVRLGPAGTQVLTTTRRGGVSKAPFDSWNLGAHVGDDPAAVSENRHRLAGHLPEGVEVCWLNQVHGTAIVHAAQGQGATADAVWSDDPRYACAVMTADCLPVVLASDDGGLVAVAHAGWRGLAAGVLPATLEALPVAADTLSVWLGPAIGPRAYQVDAPVRDAFIERMGPAADACFSEDGDRWRCDLYALARLQLAALGIDRVTGGDRCTLSEPADFFSHRRDGTTGRMATVAWLEPTKFTL